MDEKVDINTLHNLLIEYLLENELIQSEGVEAAFRAIPRHYFLPDVPPEEVYTDRAIPTRYDENEFPISSSSQPAIMAIMLEQLALKPGDNVLEVGAGTGYNAALMGHIVGAGGRITTGRVTTMDIDEEIVSAVREHLEAVGCSNVTAVCGDGMDGFTGNAPYDAIILTVGGWEIAPAWLEQLKEDGRILLPLSFRGPQLSVAFEREGQGLRSVSIAPCGFMRLRGSNAEPYSGITLNEEKTMYMGYGEDEERPHRIEVDQINQWLAAPAKDISTGLQVLGRDLWGSFQFWLALHEPQAVVLSAQGDAVAGIPVLLGWMGERRRGMSLGLVGEGGMAFFVRPSDWRPPEEPKQEEPKPFELGIRGYGEADSLVERLREVAMGWDENGRVGTEGMRVRVFPLDDVQEGGLVVRRQWHKFVVDWP